MSIPAHDPQAGDADEQERHFEFVCRTELPVHFVWGAEDIVFTTEWGRAWHALIPHSTWDDVPAGHFLQDTHGPQVVEFVLHRAGLA